LRTGKEKTLKNVPEPEKEAVFQKKRDLTNAEKRGIINR
jgi:hypothetical protein